jgi:hypothetical protein
LVERQEAGGTWFGTDAEVAAVLAHNAHGVVESQSQALAGRLGGEEGFEDALL